MIICPSCGSRNHEYYDRCINCGADIGFPNVRMAEAEKTALNDRYDAEMKDAAQRGAGGVATAFEQAAAQSQAVVNLKPRQLESMIEDPYSIYTNYYGLVGGGVRMPAETKNDCRRSSIDDLLFGSVVGKKITFAALSIGGRGLVSYGAYSLTLREDMIKHRISLLEENSFIFAERHGVSPYIDAPKGYRAVWSDRGRLAVAKLARQLTGETPATDFARILLHSDGKRANDRFVEAHIYGFFTFGAVAKVTGAQGDEAVTEKLRELADTAGALWEHV